MVAAPHVPTCRQDLAHQRIVVERNRTQLGTVENGRLLFRFHISIVTRAGNPEIGQTA
jgi:hypothetical protein